jgi:hypothetical protein
MTLTVIFFPFAFISNTKWNAVDIISCKMNEELGLVGKHREYISVWFMKIDLKVTYVPTSIMSYISEIPEIDIQTYLPISYLILYVVCSTNETYHKLFNLFHIFASKENMIL